MAISEILLLSAGSLVLLLIAAVALARLSLMVVTVQGDSMAPTLVSGERVLVWHLFPTLRLREGQIVLITQEIGPLATPYIKRITALSGEICTFLPRGPEIDGNDTGNWGERTWHIPPDAVFVCGDNQENSIDSRTWGPLPRRRVSGIVLRKLPRSSHTHTLYTVEPTSKQGPQRGEIAPPFSASATYGEYLTQQDCLGQATLLIFIGTDSVCRRNIPTYQAFCDNASSMNIRSLFVCNALAPEAQAFATELSISQPVLVAPREQNPFLTEYKMEIVPTYCLLDEDGVVRAAGLASQILFATTDNIPLYMNFTPKKSSDMLMPNQTGRP